MKNQVKKIAPLYHVIGTTTKKVELHIRIIPLTRAVEKGDAWLYPSVGGTKKVLTSTLNKIEFEKAYKGYCVESGIESLVELINSTHNSVLNPTVDVIVSAKIPVIVKAVEVPVQDIFKATNEIINSVVEKKFSKRDQEDIDAVNDILAGKTNKFSVLYKRYYPIINYKYSSSLKYNKELADDLTADLFIKVYENIHKYKPNFTFNSWISRIASNFLIDYSRKKSLETVSIDAGFSSEKMRNEDSETSTFDVHDQGTLNPEEMLIVEQKNLLVNNAINSLGEKCRITMEKRFLEEKSYNEIAEELNIPLGTVKASIFRGKAELEKIVKANKNVLESVLA